MTTSFSPGYLLGIGSNLSPQEHVGKIIESLMHSFPSIIISRVLTIPPIGMNSQYDFLNLVAFIETDWEAAKLKQRCNDIETALGRDRRDPDRKTKDRTADLDILLHLERSSCLAIPPSQITDEYFLYPLIDELFAYMQQQDSAIQQAGVPIQYQGLTFGETATTINRNATTG